MDSSQTYQILDDRVLGPVLSDASLPSESGQFRIRIFLDSSSGSEHAAVYCQDDTSCPPLVRVHSECLTGDVFGSLRCDCGAQLRASMEAIREHGHGAILYLRQEGRGIGLHAKIQAYALQEQGHDTLDANLLLGLPGDAREFGISQPILESLEMTSIVLLTNNPLKVSALENEGIEVLERRDLVVGVNDHNREYLATKLERMGHVFDADTITNSEP
ncbi:MAG TPA: GTP cyclohydrolase II [Candidatus Poseidoniales archaeon]|nr:GTP cyclohydrolase II [Candidatus Poseidoniales archaeon]